jgi:hypothetical protein
MLPPYHSRTALDVTNYVRAGLPPITNIDWMPATGVEAIDALRPLHRQAVLKLDTAIADLPGALAAVDRQITGHAEREWLYNRACRLAVKRGEMVPPKVEPAGENVANALTAAWEPVQRCFAKIDGVVRMILAELQRHGDELDRRHIIPGQLRGEWYSGPTRGPRTTPRELTEGARDGSLVEELEHLKGIVSTCRAVLDPPLSPDARQAA